MIYFGPDEPSRGVLLVKNLNNLSLLQRDAFDVGVIWLVVLDRDVDWVGSSVGSLN